MENFFKIKITLVLVFLLGCAGQKIDEKGISSIGQTAQQAEAYYNRGIAHAKKNMHDQAIADYSKAININPRDADAYYNRGVAYDDKGMHDQAIANYSRAHEINPQRR